MRSPAKSIVLLVLLYLLLGDAWIMGSDFLLERIFPDPLKSAEWQTVKGLAFVFGTAIYFYLGLRSTVAATAVQCNLERARLLNGSAPPTEPFLPTLNVRVPLLIFLFLVLVLSVAGGSVYLQVSRAMRYRQWETLRDIASLKTQQVASWRQERSGDAAVITGDGNFMAVIRDWLRQGNPDSPIPERISRRFEALRRACGYRAILISDIQGFQRYPEPGSLGNLPENAVLLQSLQENKPVFSAFYSPLQGESRIIDFIVPLSDDSKGKPEVFGALVLQVEGDSRLFPALQWWPRETGSAETLLVQKRGEAIFSVVSFGVGKDAELRMSTGSDPVDPMKDFVSRLRDSGLFDAIDYRGRPVIAAVKTVPDSDWMLITKMDQVEIQHPISRVAMFSGGALLFLIAGSAVGVGLWWRQQEANVALERLQGQLQRKVLRTHYDSLMKLANDIILLLNDEGRIVEVNDRAVLVYGYPREELIGRDVRELRDPGTLADFDKYWQAAFDQGVLFETVHRRADGRLLPVEVSARRIEVEGKVWCQSIIRDITERKQAERKIQRLTRLYNVLSQTSKAIVRYHGVSELLHEICRVAVELGHLRMAVIASIDPNAKVIKPMAAYGAESTFLETINYPTLGGNGGDGPTLQVIRKKQSYICNDVTTDPQFRNQRETAERFGWQSVALFPILSNEKIFGTLNLYAAEKDFFDPDLAGVLEEMAIDITFALNNFEKEAARKKAEERLLETTGTLAAMYQATPLPVTIIDLEERVTFWNPAAEEVFGWSEEEVAGRPLPLVPVDQKEEFSRHIAQAKRGDLLRGVEVRRQRRDGAQLDMLLFTAPLYSGDRKVNGFVSLHMDITEQKKAREHIVCLAHYDQLTGLGNRTLLRERFSLESSRARREERSLALCLIDLDKFKAVNDALGHSLGDKLLVQVARRLEHNLRRADVICRPGGDEFLLLLTGLEAPQNSGLIARKILQSLGEPFTLEGHTVRITASMGISIYPEDGVDLDTLFQNADTAMYSAKEKGRNNFMFFHDEMNQRIRDRLDMENILRAALESRSFFLQYQPQVDIRSGQVVGAEALLRYRHPERGLIPPNLLIPVAEDTGLIVAIGEWILEEACRQLRLWQEAGLTDLTMSINLSPVQIFQENFLDRAMAILKEQKIPADRLKFELTESILLEENARVRLTLLSLKKLGAGISLDDFGTGYSSLSYLKRYAVDEIKIDRTFVKDVCHDPGDAAIVAATIQMARNLGLSTVAEGVEEAEQLEFLQKQQCDSYQGYLCKPPLPAEDFVKLCRDLGSRSSPAERDSTETSGNRS